MKHDSTFSDSKVSVILALMGIRSALNSVVLPRRALSVEEHVTQVTNNLQLWLRQSTWT